MYGFHYLMIRAALTGAVQTLKPAR